MRRWISVGLLALIICTGGPAQVEAQFRYDCVAAPHLWEACEARWVEECSKHWDAATNMSIEDYVQACRRMSRERVEFLSKQKRD